MSGLSDVVAISAGGDPQPRPEGGRHRLGLGRQRATASSATAAPPTVSLRYRVSGLSDVVAIAAGRRHSLALKADGTVWAWGNNTDGQLGDGTTTDRLTPVQVSGLSDVVAIAAGLRTTASP